MKWIYLHKLHIQFMGQQPEKWWFRAVAGATQHHKVPGLGVAARPARVPRSGVGCLSLTAPSTNVLIKPNPRTVSFLLLQNLYLWQIIKKIERSFTSAYFWLLKYSFSLGSKNRWKWWCVHPSHNISSLTHCCSLGVLHLSPVCRTPVMWGRAGFVHWGLSSSCSSFLN